MSVTFSKGMFGIGKSPVGNIGEEPLKLLQTFRQLFNERSVMKAAAAMNVTQSAVSKQLKKLRDWFEDELFVRTAEGLMPTERAIHLIHQVESIIEQVDGLNHGKPFSPSELTGQIVIETTDEVSRMITPSLLEVLAEQAPRLTLRIKPLEQTYSIKALESGHVDAVISVNWHAPEQLMQKRLRSEQFVVVMSASHPLAQSPLNIEDYAHAHHLLVAPLSMQRGYIDEVLAQRGLQRHVRLVVPTFGEITAELLGDSHIITVPNQVAIALSKQSHLILKSLPFELPMFNYYLFWHRRFSNNQRHLWLRGHIEKVFASEPVPVA